MPSKHEVPGSSPGGRAILFKKIIEGIVCLPVHDAVAVPLDYIGGACDEMRYQWDKRMNVSGLARVTTDIPA